MAYFFNCFLICFVVTAVSSDLCRHRIPNWLSLPGIAIGVLFNAFLGVPKLMDSLLGFGLGLAVLLGPFVFGWLGAGDVKFLAAVGAILGVHLVPRIFFYTAIIGVPLAVVSVLMHGFERAVFKKTLTDLKLLLLSRGAVLPPSVAERASMGSRVVPYGVAIGMATLVAYYFDPRGEWAGF